MKCRFNMVIRNHAYLFAGVVAYSNAHFGEGTGPIFMNGVSCSGLEPTLLNCSYDSMTDDDYHAEDAGVQCQLR